MKKKPNQLTPKVHKPSFSLGFQAGMKAYRNSAMHSIDVAREMHKLFRNMAMELVAIQTLALASSDDNMLHEQLTSRRKRLEGVIGDIDVMNRALPDGCYIDTTWATHVRDALADIQAFKMSVQRFRQIVGEAPALEDLLSIREDYLLDQDPREQVTRWIGEHYQTTEDDLIRAGKKRVTARMVGREMIRQLEDRPTLNPVQEAVLERLKASRNLGDYMRQQKHRAKRA